MSDPAKRLYQNTTEQGGNYPQGQIIVRCEVVAQLSGTNGYIVRRVENAVGAQNLIIAAGPGGLMPYGHGAVDNGSPIPPGTMVFVLEAPLYADSGTSQTVAARQIIAVCSENSVPTTEYFPYWAMDSDPIDSTEFDKAIAGYSAIQRTDRLRGRPADMTPGDWGVFGAFKNNIFVGAARTSIEGSPVAGMHFYPDDSTVVFNKGLKFVADNPWSRRVEFVDVDGESVEFETIAKNLPDALGATSNDIVNPVPKEGIGKVPNAITLADQNKPNWEEMNYRGGVVNGKILQRVGKRTGANIPTPFLSEFSGRDGTHYDNAAHSITLSRSLDMPFLEYTKELDDISEDQTDTEAPAKDPTADLDLDGYASLYADLLYELMKKRFAERYWAKLKKRNKEWTALSAHELAVRMARSIMEEEGSLNPIGANDPAYVDNVDVVADPIANDEDVNLRLARLESFIHLSPTGAVVISDARGSEIRLEGGIITVSPSVDLRLLPGRDLAVMTPRTLSMTGGKRVELNSDQGEIDIHADKNVVVSSEKVLTLESRDPYSVTDAAYNKRGEGGGGVIIRSASETHVIGSSIRLGLQGPSDREKDGVSPFTGGAIILDAGASPIVTMSNSFTVHADREVNMTSGDKGTGLIIDGNNFTIASNSLVLCVNSALFGGTVESEWFSVDPGDVWPTLKSFTVSHNEGVSVGIKGALAVRNNIAAENITAANGVFRTLRSFTGREQESLYIPPKQRTETGKNIGAYRQLDDVSITIEAHSPEHGENWYSNYQDSPLLTADGVRRLGIYYPNAEGYFTDKSFFVTSRWQRMLKVNGAGSWVPTQLIDADDKPMLFYPGNEAWTDHSKGFVRSWTVGAETLDNPASLQESWTINC